MREGQNKGVIFYANKLGRVGKGRGSTRCKTPQAIVIPAVTLLTPLAFTVCISTENQNQGSLYPFALHTISVLIDLTLGHLHYHLTDVPPQPNSQPDGVLDEDRLVLGGTSLKSRMWTLRSTSAPSNKQKNDKSSDISPEQQGCSHLFYPSHVFSQGQTRVKLNRVFFPH